MARRSIQFRLPHTLTFTLSFLLLLFLLPVPQSPIPTATSTPSASRPKTYLSQHAHPPSSTSNFLFIFIITCLLLLFVVVIAAWTIGQVIEVLQRYLWVRGGRARQPSPAPARRNGGRYADAIAPFLEQEQEQRDPWMGDLIWDENLRRWVRQRGTSPEEDRHHGPRTPSLYPRQARHQDKEGYESDMSWHKEYNWPPSSPSISSSSTDSVITAFHRATPEGPRLDPYNRPHQPRPNFSDEEDVEDSNGDSPPDFLQRTPTALPPSQRNLIRPEANFYRKAAPIECPRTYRASDYVRRGGGGRGRGGAVRPQPPRCGDRGGRGGQGQGQGGRGGQGQGQGQGQGGRG